MATSILPLSPNPTLKGLNNTMTELDTEALFRRLVENALDFFGRAVDEVDASPKFSIIHFSTAVELILKARLLKEHWSLVFSDLEAAHPDKLLSGEFRSVDLHETRVRLKRIAGEDLGAAERDTFMELRDHRNRLIHFVHGDYGEEGDDRTQQETVSELCRGWFYLHGLLADRWSEEFSDFGDELDELSERLTGIRQFLEAKYDAIEERLLSLRREGRPVLECRVCGFEAVEARTESHELKQLRCHVCEWEASALVVDCPDCGEKILSYELGEGECGNCGFCLTLERLIDWYVPPAGEEDLIINQLPAHCTWCGFIGDRTVVEWGDKFLCLSCLESHERLSNCGFCNAPLAGSAEGTYLSGCVMCEGKLGWDDS